MTGQRYCLDVLHCARHPFVSASKFLLFLTTSLAAGCSSDGEAPTNAQGGSAPTNSGGAASPTAGAATLPANGGASGSAQGGRGGAVSAGGQSSGGVSSSGGAGGRSSGGASQSSGGGGAASSGGSAGTAGTAGGGATDAKPSAGCSKATGRPSSGAVDVAGDHYFTFPSDYDGTKPFPVLLGFHGCGGDNRGTDRNSTEYIKLTKGTAFETSYVRAVPVSSDSGGCWTYNTDISRVTKMYDDLTANYCVDTNHVFATGHSSGAQFIVQILTKKNDAAHFNFKAVAPTAASDYGALAGPTPVMYIQGKMDSVRGEDGSKTVARFVAANGCASTSKPLDVGSCQSGSTTVAPGCINYDSCTVPTVWCSHNDPAYSGTSHGVPCFAMKAMNDFFVGLH